MKVDVFKLGSGELVFYPSVVGRVISVGHFDNPVSLLGTIDLPIENPKETKPEKVVVLQVFDTGEIILVKEQTYLDYQGHYSGYSYLGLIDYHPSMKIDYPKKKLVEGFAEAVDYTSMYELLKKHIPHNAVNFKITYGVEE